MAASTRHAGAAGTPRIHYDRDVTMALLNVELIPCDHLKTYLIHYGEY